MSTAPTGHVEVALRVRPLLPAERERGEFAAVTVDAPTVRVVRPIAAAGHNRVGAATSSAEVVEARAFAFDCTMGPSTTQAEAFERLRLRELCDDALAGRAVAVLSYGQTGSGKTYTLSGPCASRSSDGGDDGAQAPPAVAVECVEDGLQLRAVRYLATAKDAATRPAASASPAPRVPAGKLRRRDSAAVASTAPGEAAAPRAASAAAHITLRASYLELYDEQLCDLLQEGRGGLRCRWSAATQCFFVEGSAVVECESAEDLLAVLHEGHRYRHRAAHRLNDESSRSHALFTVYVETVSAAGTRHGKMTFVDLAGSERLRDTGSSGSDVRSINRSLFALGNVVEKLSQNAGGQLHIPYRSSVLTQLLMDSLSGAARTLVVVCASPSSRFVEETLRTLRFAQRARSIATAPAVRVDPAAQRWEGLKREVQRLRGENALLRAALGLSAPEEASADSPLTEEAVHAALAAVVRSSSAAVPPLPPQSRPSTVPATDGPRRNGAASATGGGAGQRGARRVTAPGARLQPLPRARSRTAVSPSPARAGGGTEPAAR